MNVTTLAILVLVASGVMLLAPLASSGSRSRSVPVPVIALLYLVQLSPVIVTIAYFQYAETHMRIPFYSYSRPTLAAVFGSLLVLQCVVTGLVLTRFPLPTVRKVTYTALSGLAALGVAFVGAGMVACMNGNCF